MDKGLESLFCSYYGSGPDTCVPITGSGSNRQYYRLGASGISAIGVSGKDALENRAFIGLARHFRDKGLNVPEVYAVSGDMLEYLQEDLGDESLFGSLSAGRSRASSRVSRGMSPAEDSYSDVEKALLCGTVSSLAVFQVRGAEGLDFSQCYPVSEFNARSIMFDLNYFKYCFLKQSGIEPDEMLLEDDFCALMERLLSVEGSDFMYRDFQARNVMLRNGEPFFIDFQGGRKGPVHYDLASFVWQAKACYPASLKSCLVSAYLDSLELFRPVDRDRFKTDLRHFVLFRILQVLGAYGFRGLFEKKSHFVESIPYAMAALREFFSEPFNDYPYLCGILSRLSSDGSRWSRFLPAENPSVTCSVRNRSDSTLTVEVTSFSYKKGIPEDTSGNGGGYVFDCRALNNPGRYLQYRNSTGRDSDVISFLEKDGGVFPYLENVYGLVDSHIRCFLERGFTHLSVNFGCTGGQHRSVYCAESLARHIREVFGTDVRVVLVHREQNYISSDSESK